MIYKAVFSLKVLHREAFCSAQIAFVFITEREETHMSRILLMCLFYAYKQKFTAINCVNITALLIKLLNSEYNLEWLIWAF